ncbi:MAG: radical SAM protein [Oscillospiraceae bacterium]|nr:radical SAM protein [Oscillospiraceae bacterium]
MDGFISNIDRLCTAKGPGIRSAVMAVGCPMKCLWCSHPELIGDAAKFLYHPRRCVGCGKCVAQSGGGTICYYDAYEKYGEIISENELASRLLTDKDYYDTSGGGVTYSGGDAAMQAEFFYDVTRLLKKSQIHVALETAGYFPWEKLAPLVFAVDLVLYDIKTLNRGLHRRYTGVDNQLILENALRIADMGKDMTVRMILIPGINDSEDEITGRVKFVKTLGKHVKLEIIKYQKLDPAKYAEIGMIEMMEGTDECSDATADLAAHSARQLGIEVVDRSIYEAIL